MIDLAVKIGSLELKNPVIVASGCFGVGREYAEVYDISKLGGIVTKTITVEPRQGNAPPRLCETPSGMLNSIGLANPGVDAFIKNDIPFLEGIDCAHIVSIAGETVEEFALLVKRLDRFDTISAFELNVSCPNVERGGMAFGTSRKIVAELVAKIRALTAKSIWVKLTPNVTDIAAIGKAAVDSGADALCAINTLTGMEVDVERRIPRIGNVIAGLSGPAIRPVALASVFKLHRALPTTPIVGVGGIGEPRDAIAHMLVGATAVQVASGIFHSPLLPLDTIEGIAGYCNHYGIARPSELTGALIVDEK